MTAVWVKNPAVDPIDTPWTRLYGTNRVATMKDIATGSGAFVGVNTVIVATAAFFPDALAATGLAGITGAPIVLTYPASLSAEAESVIQTLHPTTIYLIGGESALFSVEEVQLRTLAPNVTRLAGANRTLTALEIYKEGVKAGAWGDTAIIANGWNFADALSVSPLSYAERYPIFLSNPSSGLDANTIATLKSAIAVGTAVITDALKAKLEQAAR